MIEDRNSYRQSFDGGLSWHNLILGETDLAIGLSEGIWNKQLAAKLNQHLSSLRIELQQYIATDPNFAASHSPYPLAKNAPNLAQAMMAAAKLADVGPMAAVAGAFAAKAAEFLAAYSSEIIIENGGDIVIDSQTERKIAVFAGDFNPFSGRLAIKLAAEDLPLAICTSSGTIGHSFSYGCADAAIIIAKDAFIADALATATANRILSADDLEDAVNFAYNSGKIKGVLAIKDESLAVCGDIELIKISV